MTARYFPASMSSLRKRTSFLVYSGTGSNTRLSPIHLVSTISTGTCHTKPPWVVMNIPPGRSARRHRLNECLPTASKMTSYFSPPVDKNFAGAVLAARGAELTRI